MIAQKRLKNYVPTLQAFNQQYACQKALKKYISYKQQVLAEQKYKETFQQFDLVVSTLSSMNKQLVVLQNKAWIANTKIMEHLISIQWVIHDLGIEGLKNRVACNKQADDIKTFSNFYCFIMLGQSTNNVGSSNQTCDLKRAVKKLYTIYCQVGTLIHFASSCQIRFILCQLNLVITSQEVDAPTTK